MKYPASAEEKARHDRFKGRIEEGLTKLKKQCETRRVKTINTAEQRKGRIFERNTRAALMFDISVAKKDGRIKVQWCVRDEPSD